MAIVEVVLESHIFGPLPNVSGPQSKPGEPLPKVLGATVKASSFDRPRNANDNRLYQMWRLTLQGLKCVGQ
jgi:hypothetical protein